MGRYAYDNCPRLNIFDHYSTCADDRSFTDDYVLSDGRSCANMRPYADPNRAAEAAPCCNVYVVADDTVVLYDGAGIYDYV